MAYLHLKFTWVSCTLSVKPIFIPRGPGWPAGLWRRAQLILEAEGVAITAII